MIKWVFFDLGWTLVDETLAHRARWDAARDILSTYGVHLSTDELMRLSEQAATTFADSPFRAVLNGLNITNEQRQSIVAKSPYNHNQEVLYPGVPALLSDLSRSYKLGVIANQSRGTEDRLKAWGIHELFSLIFASTELSLSKPDRRIFHLSITQAGCKANEIALVGDRLDNDIGPAMEEGWKTIRVLQGFFRLQAPRNNCEKPNLNINTIAELPKALKELAINQRLQPQC